MQGNTSIERKYFTGTSRGNFRAGYKYYFDIAQCEKCPLHVECVGNDKRKFLQVGLNTMQFYEISQYQKTEEFREKYKKRASIEGKNAELKRFHGLSRARGYGFFKCLDPVKIGCNSGKYKEDSRNSILFIFYEYPFLVIFGSKL